MEKYLVDWQHAQNTPGTRFECGFCGTNTSPAYGYYSSSHRDNNKRQGFVLVCSYCNRPSFVDKEGETILFISPLQNLESL